MWSSKISHISSAACNTSIQEITGSCTGARLSGTSCGKDKNVAEENIENLFLTPDDIRGAAVKNEEVGKLTVNHLSFG